MKEYGLLNLRVNGVKRVMHYTSDKELLYMLTINDSKKVMDIKENPSVEISFDLKSDNFKSMKCKIIIEKEESMRIYEKMLNEKSTHFKEYNKNLVVLKINN